ncbi:unnamed protein product [Heligmosomoides polygyrus]|uniref:Helicase C-terminal domain-containing protein n=1 Tax=Heligmosomoides polygyrus TaxID=6339 RepID=A0A183FEA0_HELPZ|nr:unnamed protein product [Heligmosomoides polygyrus]
MRTASEDEGLLFAVFTCEQIHSIESGTAWEPSREPRRREVDVVVLTASATYKGRSSFKHCIQCDLHDSVGWIDEAPSAQSRGALGRTRLERCTVVVATSVTTGNDGLGKQNGLAKPVPLAWYFVADAALAACRPNRAPPDRRGCTGPVTPEWNLEICSERLLLARLCPGGRLWPTSLQ